MKLVITSLISAAAISSALAGTETSDADFRRAAAYAVNCHDDLVAALEVALDVMNYVDGENDCSRAIEAAELALAKARGEG